MAATNSEFRYRNFGPAAGDPQEDSSQNDTASSKPDQMAADGSAGAQGNAGANANGSNAGANDGAAGGAGADSGATGGSASGSADASGGGTDGGGAGTPGATDGSGADSEGGATPVEMGDLTDGLSTDGLSDTVSDVVQTVGTLGSSGPLQDIVNTSGLLDGLDVNNLDNVLGGSLGGNALGGNGLDGGVLGATNGITPMVSDLGVVSNLADPVVTAAGDAVDTVTGGSNIGDVLNGAGHDAGTLVDAVRSDIDSVTSNGIVGNVVDGLGDDVLTGAVGGGGLLAGTPLDGLQGDGALVSSNLLQGDSSSPSSLIQLGAGTDQSQGLLNVDAASDRDGSGSNDLLDTNIGPSSSDNGVNANLLGASEDSGALLDADAGQTQQTSPITVDAATNADQFQFPALAGTGVDSLVGETGQLSGDLVTADTGDGLLPLSAQADDTTIADISGPDGLLDSPTGDGTHIAVNTPLQGALI